MYLLWHNDKEHGAGGTSDFGEYLKTTRAVKRFICSMVTGLEADQYRLGRIVDIVHAKAGFNTQPVRILAKERIADEKIKIIFEYGLSLVDLLVWEQTISGKHHYIQLSATRTALLFYIQDELMARLDSNGNLYITNYLYSYESADSGTLYDDPIYAGSTTTINFGVKANGNYRAKDYLEAVDVDGELMGRMHARYFQENIDLSGESIADYYESDSSSFRMSVNKSDVILKIDTDGLLQITGRLYETYNF